MTRLYLSYGMAKSGSTFAYALVCHILRRAGFEQHSTAHLTGDESAVGLNRTRDVSAEGLDRLRRGLPAGSFVAIKTHAAVEEDTADLIRQGVVFAHAVCRDPRDIALSMLDHGERSRAAGVPTLAKVQNLEDTIRPLRRHIERFRGWSDTPGVLTIDYETLVFDTPIVVAKLLDQMGFEGDPQELAASFPGKVRTKFNKGVSHRFRNDMGQEWQDRFRERFGGFIDRVDQMSPRRPPSSSGSSSSP